MPTPSPKLGLALPAQTDPFSTADIRTNWEKLDAAPGTHICTSTTRPVWGASQSGRRIFETNTNLEWLWTGSAWRRLNSTGLLKRTDGSWAIAERVTDFSTTSNTFVRVVALTGVVVPAGNRPIRVDLSYQRAINKMGNFEGAIYRSNTNASGPVMARWHMGTSPDDRNAGGGVFFAIERNGLAAGTYDFSFQITAPDGTSTINARTSTPTSLFVSEM